MFPNKVNRCAHMIGVCLDSQRVALLFDMDYWMTLTTRKTTTGTKNIAIQCHCTLNGKVQQRMFQVPADLNRPNYDVLAAVGLCKVRRRMSQINSCYTVHVRKKTGLNKISLKSPPLAAIT